jgi:hypothetical protein
MSDPSERAMHLLSRAAGGGPEGETCLRLLLEHMRKEDLVFASREELDWARGLRGACEGAVVVAREEWERVQGELQRALASKGRGRGGARRSIGEQVAADVGRAAFRSLLKRL